MQVLDATWCTLLALALAACADEPPRVAEPAPSAAPPVEAPAMEAPPVEAQPEPEITLAASGDLVLNPHALRAVLDDGEAGYTNLLAGYAASLREDEIAFLNLEQPLVSDLVALDPGWPRQDTSRPRRSPILGATPPLADALAAAGVDVVSVSNNHAYDQGYRGLSRTLEELSRARLPAVGAGPDMDAAFAPVVIERNGVRVAFVACSEFFNQDPSGEVVAIAAPFDDARVEASLRHARTVADVVVLSVHWSRDFLSQAALSERRLARRLVTWGADVILGAGPHVLHAVERLESPRGEALVAYSLGNVASGMGRTYVVGQPPRGFIHPANVTPEARDGVILRVVMRAEGGAIAIRGLEATPLWTDNTWLAHQRQGAPHRVRVVPLSEADPALRAERGPRIARALGDAVTLRLAEP